MRNRNCWFAAAIVVAALSGLAPTRAAATIALLEPPAAGARLDGPRLLARELAAGGVAALVAVPAGLGLAVLAGTLTSDLYATLLVPLAVYLPIAPVAIALAAWWIGNRVEPGGARFWPAFWAGLGVHFAAFAAGALLGVSVRFVSGFLLYGLVEAILLPGTIAGVMVLTRPEAPAPAAAAPPSPPVAVQPWIPALAVRF